MTKMTTKRKYVKPRCEVYKLLYKPQLLQTSGDLEDYLPQNPQNWP